MGKKEKVKKSIFKRWWFWLIVVVVLFILFVALGSGGDNENDTKKVSSENKTASKKLDKTYKVGDTVSYKGYEIKVNSVKYSQGNEYEKPDNGKEYVIVNVTITNNTDSKQSYNPYDFKLNADGNGTDLDEIVTDVAEDELQSGDLDKGATVSGNMIGQAKKDVKKLKLQYQANFWNDKTVDIDLK